ncbi:TPA: hypothetical protein JS563_004850 [Serratia marcescens]|nr:hypothetical protein [Serratia marcescens]
MAITSAFQADDAGSIPADRSNINVLMQADFFRRPTWTADSAVKTMLSLHSLSTFISRLILVITIKRWWQIRTLKRQWSDDRSLRKAAIKKDWFGVLEVFHFERSYMEIKRGARLIALS